MYWCSLTLQAATAKHHRGGASLLTTRPRRRRPSALHVHPVRTWYRATTRASPQAEWFIEAYSADASTLEVSGELLVATACALVEQALVKAPIDFATRAGVRSVSKLDNVWSVAGQPINYTHPALAAQAGMDSAVNLQGTNYGSLSLQVPQALNVVAQGEIDHGAQTFSGAGDWALLVSSQTINYLTHIYTHLVPNQAQNTASAPGPAS